MLVTETAYVPGMSLPNHSHGSSHLAILLEGGYLERTATGTYLCVPGDAIHYSRDVMHDNLFGEKQGRCLNLEFPEDRQPEACQVNRVCVPSEIQSLVSTSGRLAARSLPTWLITARERIDSAPATSLAPLADELAVHPGYLAKAFRKAFGLSVGQYSRLQRIRLAANLLIHTDSRVAEVAFDAGFYDQSHLTNSMLSLTGFTPASLRQIARE